MSDARPDPTGRRVLVLAHTGRAEVREVARACVQRLTEHGIAVRLLADEAADLGLVAGPGGSRPDPRKWLGVVATSSSRAYIANRYQSQIDGLGALRLLFPSLASRGTPRRGRLSDRQTGRK